MTSKDTADQTFRLALAFASEGNFVAACPLLDRVVRLDPTEGTLFARADCRDHEGKIATALRHWRAFDKNFKNADAENAVISEKRQAQLEKARERIKVLEAEVPRLKVVSRQNESTDLKLFIDGTQIALDESVELDPGEHRLIIARSQAAREIRIIKLVRGKPTAQIEIDSAAEEARVRAKNTTGQTRSTVTLERAKAEPDEKSIRNRSLGMAGVALGGAGIITAGVMGAVALTKKGTVDAECTTDSSRTWCSPAGLAAANEGRTLADFAAIPLVFGAALATVGVVLIVRSPKMTTTAGITWTNNGMPTLSVRGSF